MLPTDTPLPKRRKTFDSQSIQDAQEDHEVPRLSLQQVSPDVTLSTDSIESLESNLPSKDIAIQSVYQEITSDSLDVSPVHLGQQRAFEFALPLEAAVFVTADTQTELFPFLEMKEPCSLKKHGQSTQIHDADEPPRTARSRNASQQSHLHVPSHSLSFKGIWDYLCDELMSTDLEDNHDFKTARVRNFLNVPQEVERFMFFGFLICLDSFLYTFTILPDRFMIAIGVLIGSLVSKSIQLKPAQKCDIMKMSLFAISSFLLTYVDPSQLYHSIRGQAVIKLYVIFNVLDVLNRLGSAFGHDILDSLFSRATIVAEESSTTRRLRRSTHYLVALLYILAHCMILFYQMIALNVAINSYSNSLLPIMLSSNFVEIKSSVFKKCEERNLFNISCAGILS